MGVLLVSDGANTDEKQHSAEDLIADASLSRQVRGRIGGKNTSQTRIIVTHFQRPIAVLVGVILDCLCVYQNSTQKSLFSLKHASN